MKATHATAGIAVAAALAVVLSLTAGKPAPRVGQAAAYPKPSMTAGVANPDVTQANIADTICTAGWTATIRPPASYTNALKASQLLGQYAVRGDTNPADYEEDHFISLELGGDPRDPGNLWPEPYFLLGGGARQKDQVEDFLHREVCAGNITLKQAQTAITTDWYAIYQAGKAASSSPQDPSDL